MEAKTFGKKTTPTQILDSPQINKSESEKSNREIPKEKTQPPSNQKEPNQKKSSGYGQAPTKKTATKEEVKKKSETETRPSGLHRNSKIVNGWKPSDDISRAEFGVVFDLHLTGLGCRKLGS